MTRFLLLAAITAASFLLATVVTATAVYRYLAQRPA